MEVGIATEYQAANETRPEWYRQLLAANSFEAVTLEDRLSSMPQQISTAHGIETPHVFQQPAKPRAPQGQKAKKGRGGFEV